MVDYGTPYDCPKCGWVAGDEPPEPVTVEIDRAERHSFLEPEDWDEDIRGSRFVEKTKGHSDMSTHKCPKCGEESFRQGWLAEE
jgi:ribosomal protein S27AE